MRPSTSLTILLASAILALGLYFGLRRPETPAPAPEPTAPSLPAETEITSRVHELVAHELPRWKAACWDALDPAARAPGRYAATLGFDAGGKLVIFGILEFRGESDMDVATCLRRQEHAFAIPAPGRPLTYEVPFAIP